MMKLIYAISHNCISYSSLINNVNVSKAYFYLICRHESHLDVLHSANRLHFCVLGVYQKEQRLLPCKTLTDWFL